MKKLILLLSLLIIILSCYRKTEKPFIIIYKCPDYISEGYAKYGYEDVRGEFHTFYEENTKYSIGDTIK